MISRLFRAIPLLLVAALGTACDDGFQPFLWSDLPDTTMLWSLARPDYVGQASAWDFLSRRPVAVEGQGNFQAWDVAVTEEDDALWLLPAGLFSGYTIDPGIAIDSTSPFEEVSRAPRDTASYTRDALVPLRTGVVYIVRTRRNPLSGCRQYGKMELVESDAALGTARIRFVTNPFCNNRDLVPPDVD